MVRINFNLFRVVEGQEVGGLLLASLVVAQVGQELILLLLLLWRLLRRNALVIFVDKQLLHHKTMVLEPDHLLPLLFHSFFLFRCFVMI